MPWRQMPMKDVGGCEKPRGAADQALIRGYPNGETRLGSCPVTAALTHTAVEGTGGTETSQYPEEWKATATPRVAASETGRAQTVVVAQPAGDAATGSWDPPEGTADPSGSYQAIEEWTRSGKARHRG